jgi:hypothetical protein
MSTGITALDTCTFAFKPDQMELKRRKKIQALEKEAVEMMLTGGLGGLHDYSSGELSGVGSSGSSGGSDDSLSLAPNDSSSSTTSTPIDLDAKRRQLATAAIGEALRADVITKKQWSVARAMIKQDRNVRVS